jgi:uncharacterized protein (DUF433 family)
MSIIIHSDPVPLRADESGTIRVGQSRITLDVLLDYYQQGVSPEQLASAEYFSTLSLSDVHGALAYYHRHKAELDEYLRQRREEADRLQQEIEAANAPFLAQMKARLEETRARKDGDPASPASALPEPVHWPVCR